MASLIAGSNLRHRSPESHLFVRGPGDQPGDGSDCSFVVRLGVENAIQGSSNLQLSAQACMSEAKHQLGLSFTSAVYKGSLTRALFVTDLKHLLTPNIRIRFCFVFDK